MSQNSTSPNWPKSNAEVEIGRSRNWPKSKLARSRNWPNSKKKAGRSRNWPKSIALAKRPLNFFARASSTVSEVGQATQKVRRCRTRQCFQGGKKESKSKGATPGQQKASAPKVVPHPRSRQSRPESFAAAQAKVSQLQAAISALGDADTVEKEHLERVFRRAQTQAVVLPGTDRFNEGIHRAGETVGCCQEGLSRIETNVSTLWRRERGGSKCWRRKRKALSHPSQIPRQSWVVSERKLVGAGVPHDNQKAPTCTFERPDALTCSMDVPPVLNTR